MGAQASKEQPHHSSVTQGPIGKFGPLALHPNSAHHLTALSISSPLPASAFLSPLGNEQTQIAQRQLPNNSSRGPTGVGLKTSNSKHHSNNRTNLFAFPPPTEPNNGNNGNFRKMFLSIYIN